MNIGVVTQLPYPHDREVRGRKISITLHRGGYNAFIICPKGKEQKTGEKIDYAIVCRFGYCSSIFWLNRFLSISLPVNLLWALWIFQVGKEKKINLLIVRDIRLVFPAILAAKFLQAPIVWDMAENHVDATEFLPKNNLWHYIIRNRRLVSVIEKICVSLADYIWVVVEENKERLLRLGVAGEKIGIVSNTPILDSLLDKENDKSVKNKLNENFVMLYIGKVTKARGLELILRSIPYILEEDTNIEMLIVGDGLNRSCLENLIHQFHIENIIKDNENIRLIKKINDLLFTLLSHNYFLTKLKRLEDNNKLNNNFSNNFKELKKIIFSRIEPDILYKLFFEVEEILPLESLGPLGGSNFTGLIGSSKIRSLSSLIFSVFISSLLLIKLLSGTWTSGVIKLTSISS